MNLYIILGIIFGVIFLIICIAMFANSAYRNFIDVFNEFNDTTAGVYMTSSDFAHRVNATKFGGSIMIRKSAKRGLSDCYIPFSKVLDISQGNYDKASISALTVVAHELGHAMQERDGDKKFFSCLKKRKLIRVIGKLIFPFFLLGVLLFFLLPSEIFSPLMAFIICMALSCFCFIFVVATKLSTLGMERDASKRALALLKESGFDDDELEASREILKLAGNTYLASVINAMLGWTGLTNKSNMSGV